MDGQYGLCGRAQCGGTNTWGLSKEFGPPGGTRHLRCVGPARVRRTDQLCRRTGIGPTRKRLDLQWAPTYVRSGRRGACSGHRSVRSAGKLLPDVTSGPSIRPRDRFLGGQSVLCAGTVSVLSALQLAALRGVGRPVGGARKSPITKLVWLACFHSLKQLDLPGIRVLSLQQGLHAPKDLSGGRPLGPPWARPIWTTAPFA